MIILAGIGGELAADILKSLFLQIKQSKQPQSVDLLVAAQHHMFHLRSFLNEQKVNLYKEVYCHDKGKHYELLFLRYQPEELVTCAVSLTGETLWANPSKELEQYWQYLLSHYDRKWHYQGDQQAKAILHQYQQLSIALN